MRQFSNEPVKDFSIAANRVAMEEALAGVQAQLGGHYPLIIGSRRIDTPREVPSVNSSRYEQAVGYVAQAERAEADAAMDVAWNSFGMWSRVPAEARALSVMKLAAVMRRRRLELVAWLVLEVSKNWREADADVAEAIDFCEYYAREAIRYSQMNAVYPHPSEINMQLYIPLGVGVIISPWNFPLAILTGMTVAAVVTGNTVIIKPANTAGVIAAKFMEMVAEAGIPDGVVNYLPGSGATIGDYLVQNPRTRFINFTGSKDVGLHINQVAAVAQPGQIWIKRVVAEMGGKNCIVVDDAADLESASAGIVASAYGFQGQKCSACTRAIVVDAAYDEMLERVRALTERLSLGPAVDNPDVASVIDEKAYRSIMECIEIGSREGRLVTGGRGDASLGYNIEPTIIADVDPRARIAQEEVFGPVLAFMRARDFDHAIEMANDTEYGLTASVYSKSRLHIERAKGRVHVGNLYVNRGCTGALVGLHPFGGFNMSGTDSKAGGPDYLLLFTQAKSISETV
jgi:1-pyrroline-5-carboxylate dehydrogenase